MSVRKSSFDPIVVPAQVWNGLTIEAREGAIQLMARLASNLVVQESQQLHTEITSCLHNSLTPRSDLIISTGTP
jgi:hypothetical protein